MLFRADKCGVTSVDLATALDRSARIVPSAGIPAGCVKSPLLAW